MKVGLLILALATPVHEFYSPQCCSGRDCHPVACGEITASGDGWMWNGIKFEHYTLRIAPDGHCHVCVMPTPSAADTSPHPTCIYLPPST